MRSPPVSIESPLSNLLSAALGVLGATVAGDPNPPNVCCCLGVSAVAVGTATNGVGEPKTSPFFSCAVGVEGALSNVKGEGAAAVVVSGAFGVVDTPKENVGVMEGAPKEKAGLLGLDSESSAEGDGVGSPDPKAVVSLVGVSGAFGGVSNKLRGLGTSAAGAPKLKVVLAASVVGVVADANSEIEVVAEEGALNGAVVGASPDGLLIPPNGSGLICFSCSAVFSMPFVAVAPNSSLEVPFVDGAPKREPAGALGGVNCILVFEKNDGFSPGKDGAREALEVGGAPNVKGLGISDGLGNRGAVAAPKLKGSAVRGASGLISACTL